LYFKEYYEIRIISNKTLIQFCSNQTLLKNLMTINDNKIINSATHIILDELQTRNIYSDFIMILIKDILSKYKHIKFVLIGSPANVDLIQRFFTHCSMLIGNFIRIIINDLNIF
jgi:HrpA-like RNA helicase